MRVLIENIYPKLQKIKAIADDPIYEKINLLIHACDFLREIDSRVIDLSANQLGLIQREIKRIKK